MAEWKARGYVPDSDEEDESQSSEPTDTQITSNVFPGVQQQQHDTEQVRESHSDVIEDSEELRNEEVDHEGQDQNDDHAKLQTRWKELDGPDFVTSDAGIHEYPVDLKSHNSQSRNDDLDKLGQGHYVSPPAASYIGSSQDDNLQQEESCAVLPSSAQSLNATSRDSSVLSSLPSSPRAATILNNEGSPASETPSQLNIPEPDISNRFSVLIPQQAADEYIGTSRGGRSFRQRNPIQLHPYAIESEKYRQTLKSRGIRPLHIDHTQATDSNGATEESWVLGVAVQEESQLNQDHLGSPRHGSSSPVRSLNKSVAATPIIGDGVFEDDDQLPDLASLLRSQRQHHAWNGNKRRKLGYTYSKRESLLTKTSLPLPLEENEPVTSLNNDALEFDIPASPPLSDQPDLDQPHARFRVPRGLTPIGLPTPSTSSEPRSRPQLMDSDIEQSKNSRESSESAEDMSILSAEDEPFVDQSAKVIERVQRKIRGVLPASWLRLDQKGQIGKAYEVNKADTERPREVTDAHRGVARVVARARTRSPGFSTTFPMELSSDENESREAHSGSDSLPELDLKPRTVHDINHQGLQDFVECNLVRYGEAEEDNRVDPMLPTTGKRRSGSLKGPRKRIKHHGQSKAASTNRGSRREHQYQPKITDQYIQRPQKETKFRPPDLSIIDALEINMMASSSTPPFLRIAARTARSRIDKGRHSPTRKILRMATSEDTNHVNATLRDWREGTIQPQQTDHKTTSRTPLKPRSGNAVLTQKPRKPSTAMGRKKLGNRSKSISIEGSAKLQRSLENTLLRDPTNTEPRARKYKYSNKRNQVREPPMKGTIVQAAHSNYPIRLALLETSQEENDGRQSEVSFRKSLLQLDRLDKIAPSLNPVRCSRELQSKSSFSGKRQQSGGYATVCPILAKAGPKLWNRKQHQPKRMDVNLSSFGRSDELSLGSSTEPPSAVAPANLLSSGIHHFHSHYSLDLEVTPLPAGTHFRNDGLLGRGDFHHSLFSARSKDLDKDRGSLMVQLSGDCASWSHWNDEVSTGFGQIFDKISAYLGELSKGDPNCPTHPASPVALLNLIIKYTSNHLSFSDPVDRVVYLQRCMGLVTSFLQEMPNIDALGGQIMTTANESITDSRIQLIVRVLVFANQLNQIAKHDVITDDMQGKLNALTTKSMRYALSLVLRNRFAAFDRCLRDLRHLEGCQLAISTSDVPLEAFVICSNIIITDSQSLATFWQVVNNIFPVESSNDILDLRSMERLWQSLFTTLPFLEINSYGIIEVGRRFKIQCDNWAPVRTLIDRLLEGYSADLTERTAIYNPLLRACFARCFHLINDWHWIRCEGIIGALFDFFARSNLAHLRKEECHGSPTFLEQLAYNPQLSVSARDRCFHILLKVIARGLQRMRQIYPARKVRDIIWRLMPNHGRLHPKDEAIRQEDLDALRNHHDLLCTLYWASPPDFRPRLTVLRNLVNLETSHREACHLNIRAWSYLVQFQLSAQEPLSSLQPFADWHDDLIAQILRQHAQARTEAEAEARMTEVKSGLSVSKDLLESTIVRNQKQVEAILTDALISLKLAVAAARDIDAARTLLTPALIPVLGLFSVDKSHGSLVAMQALDIVLAFVEHAAPKSKHGPSRDTNDDSQDYGDWSAYAGEDVLPDGAPSRNPRALAAAHLQDLFEEPLRDMLSNCFGADTPPKDELLLKFVDVWAATASVFVSHGMKSWNDYLSPFGRDSWCSLRETQQTRKYNAYYLGCLIEVDEDIYFDHREHFLRSWIESLVERESMLKFQHRFTSSILNVDTANPLLRNLPFWAGKETGRFEISSSDFLIRRLSLITSVLSNMREAVEGVGHDNTLNLSALKQEYKDLLKHLMNAMKHNYQELGPASNVRGAYVQFAQDIVESLQQHTSTICPVDRFFTDSSAFPLPVEDPLYVVGQLKNYGLRLQDTRTPKQLAVFLQSITERAVTESQQQYLIDQLYTAVSSEFERGDTGKPTLRSFLIQAIVPAYIEIGFSTPCGWLLLSPILQALQQIFDDLLGVLDGTDEASVAVVSSTMTGFLQSLRASFEPMIWDPSFSQHPHILHLLAESFRTVTALLPTLDYIIRLGGPVDSGIESVSYLRSFASMTFEDNASYSNHDMSRKSIAGIPPSMIAIRSFALQELKASLSKYWTQHDDRIYVTRGNTRKEVIVNLGTFEEEKDWFMAATQEFLGCLEALPAFRGGDGESQAHECRRGVGLGEVMI